MNVKFSKKETAAIIKYLRLPTRKKKKFIDKLVTLELAAMNSQGYRSNIIF